MQDTTCFKKITCTKKRKKVNRNSAKLKSTVNIRVNVTLKTHDAVSGNVNLPYCSFLTVVWWQWYVQKKRKKKKRYFNSLPPVITSLTPSSVQMVCCKYVLYAELSGVWMRGLYSIIPDYQQLQSSEKTKLKSTYYGIWKMNKINLKKLTTNKNLSVKPKPFPNLKPITLHIMLLVLYSYRRQCIDEPWAWRTDRLTDKYPSLKQKCLALSN